jgi:hypothetical protein
MQIPLVHRWAQPLFEQLKRTLSGRPAREDALNLNCHAQSAIPALGTRLQTEQLLDGHVHPAPASPGMAAQDIATSWVVHPLHLCRLRQGLVHLSTGVVHDLPSGKYIVDTSWGWGKYTTSQVRRFNRRIFPIENPRPVYVFTSVGYHGIMEDLSAILLLRELGHAFDIVIDERNHWMRHLLPLFLPPGTRVRPAPGGVWVTARDLLITTKSALGEFVHPRLLTTLRRAAERLPGHSTRGSKLFISRADTRNRAYPGEASLARAHAAQGFEVLTLGTLPVTDQVLAFRNATHVAGLHGAGLANLVWGRNSIQVTEFYLPEFFNSCYASLSLTLGHRYANTSLADAPSR